MNIELRSIDPEGHYWAGSDGNIYSRRGTRGLRPLSTKSLNGGGYPVVSLSIHGVIKLYATHRLVAFAFHGPPAPGDEVNHKSGDKKDNRPDNLEWVTRTENINHRYDKLGQCRHPANTKLTPEIVKAIRRDAEHGLSYREIGDAYGIGREYAWSIVKRKVWSTV